MTTPMLDQHRLTDELIDQFLENFDRPEDLISESGILKQRMVYLVVHAMETETT